MRVRSGVVAAALAATGAVAPFAPFTPAAHAATTTSTTVAYTADTDDDGITELYVAPASGGAATQLSTGAQDVWNAAVSPDGTKVAYVMSDWDSELFDYELYVRNTDGSGTPQKIATGDDDAPAWSADGTKIAFLRSNEADGSTSVYIVPANGGAAPTLVPNTTNAFDPSFSPSGRQLVVSRFNQDTFDNLGIDVVTIATGTATRIPGTADTWSPTWSTDGQRIAYVVPGACGLGLSSVAAAGFGSPATLVPSSGHLVGNPRFSRDGTQVFYTDAPFTCDPQSPPGVLMSDVYVANADGTSPAVVATTPSVDEQFSTVGGGNAPTADTTAPAAPVINAAGTVGTTSAGVTWPAVADATEYVVVRVAHGAAAPAAPADGTRAYDGAGRSAAATGLTTGTVYDLYAFALDAWGNASPASGAHAARPLAAPTMTAMGATSSLSATVKFPVKWAGATPAFQVNYGEKTRSSTGTWSTSPVYKTWFASTAAKTATFTGAQGHTYWFQARGFDGYGNATAYSTARNANVPLNENYSGMAYSAGWVSASSSSRWLGTVRSIKTAGASMTFKTETSSFTVIGDRCNACGQLRVYVDGVLKATVDTRAATTAVRQVLYAGAALTGGIKAHTIKLVVVGTAGRPNVGLDGLGLSR
ncbi:MAG TPA: hypothetical protein VFQ85_06340 [Mycobacteriales bacterium]|jgi:hypothetical protein|nr:hypothetical protein [Mycobacteriales bacterium]